MNNWSTSKTKRPRRRAQNSVCVLANVEAVVKGLKPSYLIDHTFPSVDDIDNWLYDICNELRPQCRLSILIIEQQLFLVEINRLRDHLLNIIYGKCVLCDILVDVSFTLKRPEVKQKAECQMVVQKCAQLVYDHIKSTDATRCSIQPPADMNRTTLYGVLLGYPVVYWYDDVDDAGNCLSMVPLLVVTASVLFNSKQCDIYSFSIPEASLCECRESVDAWRTQLFEKYEHRTDSRQTFGNLCIASTTVVQSAVCL